MTVGLVLVALAAAGAVTHWRSTRTMRAAQRRKSRRRGWIVPPGR